MDPRPAGEIQPQCYFLGDDRRFAAADLGAVGTTAADGGAVATDLAFHGTGSASAAAPDIGIVEFVVAAADSRAVTVAHIALVAAVQWDHTAADIVVELDACSQIVGPPGPVACIECFVAALVVDSVDTVDTAVDTADHFAFGTEWAVHFALVTRVMVTVASAECNECEPLVGPLEPVIGN